MGKKFAPTYDNIFMAEWETSALEKCVKKQNKKNSITIDFWITSGEYGSTLNKILVFLRTLDGHNASIKLKSTINKTSIDSSDTTTFKRPTFSLQPQIGCYCVFQTHRHTCSIL